MSQRDQVDEILRQWKRERPDLDATPMGVIGRISRLALHLDTSLKAVFAKYGLQRGEFDVLATLRRSGKPYQLTPTALFKSVMLTSGAMTNRLDRLEKAGWIIRKADPEDRRSVLVSLTPAGLKLIDKAVEDHVANEHKLLDHLSESEIKTLATSLRRLLIEFEQHETS